MYVIYEIEKERKRKILISTIVVQKCNIAEETNL